MRVSEGQVTVSVPEQPDAGKGADVFFNPVQELNRDVTVAALRAYRERLDGVSSYLDATAASGIRGVRAAADGWETTLCDFDTDAVALCEENVERNGLAAEVRHADANVLMHGEAFDVVDVDPFGTPIPFADAAVQGTKRLLCVTATDTAPLCGAHFESGVRSYGTVPRNTEFHAEMGMRVLLSAMIRTAARYDIAARPILSHATKHYVRTYLEFDHGAKVANDCIDELGYVHHCQRCLWRDHDFGLIADPPEACPVCEEHLQTAGPIWLGATCDPEFAAAVSDHVSEDMGTAEKARELLSTLGTELPTPTHYDQHRLCKRWGRGAEAMDTFVEKLRDAGYDASRTHYGGTTFKTDADVTEIREATAE
ncbi:tRNA (guanine(26)-N(2))-dimethyltransferase [Haloarcula nitratireducens]|uniref:tRNA (guanine(26)-N(2))-dimethyltransferase n=1 Tax=Haloarcula nitratireducens TaxID=2487749 RepID=A0AAW4PCW1_9EURY|nr:tRNA (guanine(26)-N(2))-dimethyltransferase [Halomicroarcula nitratireducens]MBX0295669.1 tRNA (guanine(26)-N(2))-dimethyltransferase [Halomicroarcula nitratireducens]